MPILRILFLFLLFPIQFADAMEVDSENNPLLGNFSSYFRIGDNDDKITKDVDNKVSPLISRQKVGGSHSTVYWDYNPHVPTHLPVTAEGNFLYFLDRSLCEKNDASYKECCGKKNTLCCYDCLQGIVTTVGGILAPVGFCAFTYGLSVPFFDGLGFNENSSGAYVLLGYIGLSQLLPRGYQFHELYDRLKNNFAEKTNVIKEGENAFCKKISRFERLSQIISTVLVPSAAKGILFFSLYPKEWLWFPGIVAPLYLISEAYNTWEIVNQDILNRRIRSPLAEDAKRKFDSYFKRFQKYVHQDAGFVEKIYTYFIDYYPLSDLDKTSPNDRTVLLISLLLLGSKDLQQEEEENYRVTGKYNTVQNQYEKLARVLNKINWSQNEELKEDALRDWVDLGDTFKNLKTVYLNELNKHRKQSVLYQNDKVEKTEKKGCGGFGWFPKLMGTLSNGATTLSTYTTFYSTHFLLDKAFQSLLGEGYGTGWQLTTSAVAALYSTYTTYHLYRLNRQTYENLSCVYSKTKAHPKRKMLSNVLSAFPNALAALLPSAVAIGQAFDKETFATKIILQAVNGVATFPSFWHLFKENQEKGIDHLFPGDLSDVNGKKLFLLRMSEHAKAIINQLDEWRLRELAEILRI